MTTICVAGGAGYLGSTFCRLLLKEGFSVRVYDRCFFGTDSLAAFKQSSRFELLEGDIRSPSPEIFQGVDVLVDLAGLSNDPSCLLDPELTNDINIQGGMTLSQAAKDAGIRKIVYASSCSVYGSGGSQFLDETSRCNPLSYYASSKLAMEEYLFSSIHSHNCAVTALRFGTLYGLSSKMRFDLIVNIMTARALIEKMIYVNGGGQQWRPLIHVEDAARSIIESIRAPNSVVAGQIFNIGSEEQNFRVITVANIVADIIPDAKLIVVPEDIDQRSYRVSFSKCKNTLKFQTKRTVPETVLKIKEALIDGKVSFGGADDDHTITTVRYQRLTKDDPRLNKGRSTKFHRRVEFFKHNIDERDISNLQRTLRSIFLTTSSQTKKFESSFAEYLGVKRAIGTMSCTQSLFMVLKSLGIGPGDEVITTTMSFIATANAIEHAGAKPVFIDVDPVTGNLDSQLIEDAISPKTKAIMPVHLYGQMCDMRSISKIAAKHGLRVVEDCAHCIEGNRDGIRPGELSDAACFSFYATKNITSGEGGAIVTNDEDLADLLIKMRLHGMPADASSRYTGQFRPFDMTLLGYKNNMKDIDAALLIGQLERIDELWIKREEIAQTYEQYLSKLETVDHPRVLDNSKSARHLFTIWVYPSIRDNLIDKMKTSGIGVSLNYPPIHLTLYYSKKYGYKLGTFPNAENIGSRTLSLPIYPTLGLDNAIYVMEQLELHLSEIDYNIQKS